MKMRDPTCIRILLYLSRVFGWEVYACGFFE
jgi:hypothetical protein